MVYLVHLRVLTTAERNVMTGNIISVTVITKLVSGIWDLKLTFNKVPSTLVVPSKQPPLTNQG